MSKIKVARLRPAEEGNISAKEVWKATKQDQHRLVIINCIIFGSFRALSRSYGSSNNLYNPHLLYSNIPIIKCACDCSIREYLSNTCMHHNSFVV